MTRSNWSGATSICLLASLSCTAFGSSESISSVGINSDTLTQTGVGVAIGQVETRRPGDPSFDTNAGLFNTTVDPESVFFWNQFNFDASMDTASETSAHAVEVASVMISTDADAKGVATDAALYSIGLNPVGPGLDDVYGQTAQAANHLATLSGVNVRAINISLNLSAGSSDPDGRSLLTSYLDWSAQTHNVLYVVAGFESGGTGPIPSDNYNGLTVGFSRKNGGVYRQADPLNDSTGVLTYQDRSFVDLIAPGRDVQLATQNNVITTVPDPVRVGTSFAAPHVTGTVALLQQYGDTRAGQANWMGNTAGIPHYQRHEVMRAVLMNSADKLIDDGTVMVNGTAVPQGGLLGMERTVLDAQGLDWLQSEAYSDEPGFGGDFFPLDEQMGAGHLNAKRAIQQFVPGEQEPNATDVPLIGWDYSQAPGSGMHNVYRFSQPLTAGQFISATLAWDRTVMLDNDADMDGEFDLGDTFEAYSEEDPYADDVISDLDLYLMPRGAFSINQAVAQSVSLESTEEHIFFQIPDDGQYEIWVDQFDGDVGNPFYGLAWWYGVAPPLVAFNGDFDGNGMVDATDLAQWNGDFGLNADSDANGDGLSNGADFLIWQRTFGTSVISSIPEPGTRLLMLLAGLVAVSSCRKVPGTSVRESA